ncbi:MAG: hypothetical protein QM751_10375 [Paludibacteraceae bacterium]
MIEAEKSDGREGTWSSIFERNYSELELIVSKDKYIEVVPTSASVNPTVTFKVSGTLSGVLDANGALISGAAYNIYCVFLPNKVKTTSSKPNKVTFSLAYRSSTGGKVVNVTYNNSSKGFVTSSTEVTKVLVASNVAFPYCEKGLKEPNVKLKVSSSVSSNETTQYTRDMLIDCIIFEPVH